MHLLRAAKTAEREGQGLYHRKEEKESAHQGWELNEAISNDVRSSLGYRPQSSLAEAVQD